ncbi:hypothetical protein NQZ68_013575 [Dissostichus eleginoides]|nr:hypothetical protein NQZ68_013575 [Dissostichus eleginoides]
MFSLAVSIPLLENTNSLQQVLEQSDPVLNLKNTLNNNEVYVGRRVVAAKVLKPVNGPVQHAESRVVDHLDAFLLPDKASLPLNSKSLYMAEGVPPHKGETVEAGRMRAEESTAKIKIEGVNPE